MFLIPGSGACTVGQLLFVGGGREEYRANICYPRESFGEWWRILGREGPNSDWGGAQPGGLAGVARGQTGEAVSGGGSSYGDLQATAGSMPGQTVPGARLLWWIRHNRQCPLPRPIFSLPSSSLSLPSSNLSLPRSKLSLPSDTITLSLSTISLSPSTVTKPLFASLPSSTFSLPSSNLSLPHSVPAQRSSVTKPSPSSTAEHRS